MDHQLQQLTYLGLEAKCGFLVFSHAHARRSKS
jgi:hypothetical protein